MSLRNIKLEFFYLRQSFFRYKKGLTYIANKYFLTKKIKSLSGLYNCPVNPDFSAHILVGQRDFSMLLWSLASLFHVWKDFSGALYIHDDGSLSNKSKKVLCRLFPGVIIVDSTEVLSKLNPQFNISKWRANNKYFLLKKLIDPYFISPSNKVLILDSDILYFQPPQEIISGLQSDCSDSLMMFNKNDEGCPVYFKSGDRLDGNLSFFNSGIVLYKKDNFDLDLLNEYLEKIDSSDDRNIHFIEQAGYAYCLKNLKALPAGYHIKNRVTDKTIVKHYTSPRRVKFFLEGVELLKDKIF